MIVRLSKPCGKSVIGWGSPVRPGDVQITRGVSLQLQDQNKGYDGK